MASGWEYVPREYIAEYERPPVRPARYRPRMTSEYLPRQPQVPCYMTPSGHLMAPGVGGFGAPLSRSQSTGHRPVPPVVINNIQRDDHSPTRPARPLSAVAPEYDDDWDQRAHSPPAGWREHERARSRSRARAVTQVSRDPSPYYWQFREQQLEHEQTMKELEEFKKKQEDAERAKRLEVEEFMKKQAEAEKAKKFRDEMLLEQAKEEQKKKEQAKKEEELKKKAIEEWQAKEKDKAEKEKKAKAKADEEYAERLRKDLANMGISDKQITTIVNRDKNPPAIDLAKTTFIKVHRKHLSVETLDTYQLPWEWDVFDGNYIIIKRWVPEHEQAFLFDHTRKIREERELRMAQAELRKEHERLLQAKKQKDKRKASPAKVGLLDLFRA
ncbi:MAG: hypothetical protein M1836_003104 [Candelina mexicana]|nr:MAG: hypothetical protein M1836_003104 [Candelina mexicana]